MSNHESIFTISLLDELNRNVKPNHWDVNEGETAKFTCTGIKSKPLWVFNKRYPLPWDITAKKASIIIQRVQLNHSGSYQCASLSRNLFGRFFIATATLKVFGKLLP